MWIKTMERLAGTRPLYALDTPGFGGSFDAPAADRPSMAQYARWLYEAIRDLGIGRCHLVGHHTGACIAVDMVSQQPDLAQSISLFGPVPLTAEERVEFSKHFGTPFTPVISGSYLLENWEYLRNLGAHADPMLIHREMSDQLRAWWGRVQSYNAVWDQDFAGMYQAIKAPLLIAAAEEDVLYPYLDRAKQMQPNANVLAVTGANFEPDLDADTVANGLKEFFATYD
ncbi:MAG: alpha/beta fold hydrolase [Sphingomonadaceae bacterium]|nr:alpha/beta fold hydrolase [Sphingomonadaceae bacterium]